LENTSQHAKDQIIIGLLRDNNREGISMLYDHYSPALYGIILRIVKTHELAEEVLQEAFVKIWKNFESFDENKGKLFTWIINIARNSAIDQTRLKSFNRTIQPIENTVHIEEESAALLPETMDLKDLIKKLGKEHQEIIDIVYFQGYTHVEAAEALNLQLGTLKTRLRAAIKKLREMFE